MEGTVCSPCMELWVTVCRICHQVSVWLSWLLRHHGVHLLWQILSPLPQVWKDVEGESAAHTVLVSCAPGWAA